MKIRTGFVSNSSSSSFIICYALITDEAKAREALTKISDVNIYTEAQLEDAIKNSRWSSPLECDWAGVSVSMNKTGNPEQLHVIFKSYGGAGSDDSDFCNGYDDCFDMNYDVDYSDFCESKIIDRVFTVENGFDDVEVSYGAGRNG